MIVEVKECCAISNFDIKEASLFFIDSAATDAISIFADVSLVWCAKLFTVELIGDS